MTGMTMGGVTPPVGASVVSRDDIELGKVKEVTGSCFKIDAPLAADYWLGTDMIESITGDVVHLQVSNLAMEQFKQDSPEHVGVHQH